MSREQFRQLIMDQAGTLFSIVEVDRFLEMEDQNVYGAAALACLAIAADKARLGKFTLEGYADNEAAAASLFLRLAAEYRARAEVHSTKTGWAIAERPATDFARRRII